MLLGFFRASQKKRRKAYGETCKVLRKLYSEHGLCTVIQYYGFKNVQNVFCYAHTSLHLIFTMDKFMQKIVETYKLLEKQGEQDDRLTFLKSFLVIYKLSYELEQGKRKLPNDNNFSTKRMLRKKCYKKLPFNKRSKPQKVIEVEPDYTGSYKINLDYAMQEFTYKHKKYSKTVCSDKPMFGAVNFDFTKENDVSEYMNDVIILLEEANHTLDNNLKEVAESKRLLPFFGTTSIMTKCNYCSNETLQLDSEVIWILPLQSSVQIIIDKKFYSGILSDRECEKCHRVNTIYQSTYMKTPQ